MKSEVNSSNIELSEKVSLIATVYNCLDETKMGMEFFLQPDNLKLLDEIVIVDGGSSDGTWEFLVDCAESNPKLRAFSVPGANISRGRNEAIRRAEGEVLVCFDSGTRYSDTWLELMLQPFREGIADVVGSRTVSVGETFRERCWAGMSTGSVGERHVSHRGIAYRKSVWEAIGGYPEHVAAGEDTWFNRRWDYLGSRYVFQRDAISYWRVRPSLRSIFRMMRRNIGGHLQLEDNPGSKRVCGIVGMNVLFLVMLLASTVNILFLWGFLGIYAIYLWRRLLSRGRWKRNVFPHRFVVVWMGLVASDLGSMFGVLDALWIKCFGRSSNIDVS